MPREWLDAPEDLPNESRSQIALSQLKDEVPGMPDEAPAGLEGPLLRARERSAFDGERREESVAGEACPRGSPEFDAKLGIEREANRVRFRVTHRVVPAMPATASITWGACCRSSAPR
jgi:hypothetical protein